MFEDSTFESGGRIKTKCGKYMIPLFIVEGVILILLILIPLIYPEALPKAAMQMALTAPPPPRPRPAAAAGSASGPGEVGDDEQSAHGAHQDSARDQDGQREGAVPGLLWRGRIGFWQRREHHGQPLRQQRPKVNAAAPKKLVISSGVMAGYVDFRRLSRSIRPSPRPRAFRARWCCRRQSPRRAPSKICTSSAALPCCSKPLWTLSGPGATSPICSTASRWKWRPR